MIKPKKKRPKKQHDVRGSTLLDIAKDLKAKAEWANNAISPMGDGILLSLIAETFEKHGKSARKKR